MRRGGVLPSTTDNASDSTGSNGDDEHSQVKLTLAKFHWRLNLARYRLLEVLDWLREAEASSATSVSDRLPHSGGLHQGKVPFSKLMFDMLQSQLEAEQLFLPTDIPGWIPMADGDAW